LTAHMNWRTLRELYGIDTRRAVFLRKTIRLLLKKEMD